MMRWWLFVWLLLNSMLSGQNPGNIISTTWAVSSVYSIAGFPVTMSGSPQQMDSDEYGKVIWFDGIDDGLLVESNPLEGATNFTVEVIFKPDLSWPANEEQRFIHIQDPANDNRRILIELRLTDDHQWYLDTFIKSEISKLALKLQTALHPVGQWYHAALVYDNRSMKHFVNGIEEISGEVDYFPITNAHTSIGTRMNQRSWFKGSIAILKVTHSALTPENFINNVTSSTVNTFMKKGYQLKQNYPNPFSAKGGSAFGGNPFTTIKYSIPDVIRNADSQINYNQNSESIDNVSLKVYDILGSEVATLIDEPQSPGNYQVQINAGYLSSGIYLYQLKTGDFVQTRKFVLIK